MDFYDVLLATKLNGGGGGTEPAYNTGWFFNWANSYSTDGEGGYINFDETANNNRAQYQSVGGEHTLEHEIVNGTPPVIPYPIPIKNATSVKVTRTSGTTDYYASITTFKYVGSEWIRVWSSGFQQVGSSKTIPLPSDPGTHLFVNVKIGSAGTSQFGRITPPLDIELL